MPATHSHDDDDESALRRHFAHAFVPLQVAVGVVFAVGALDLTPDWFPGWIGLVLLGLALYSSAAWRRHPVAACVRCLTDIPDDGPVQAQRKSLSLWAFHVMTTTAFQIGFFIWLVAILVFGVATFWLPGLEPLASTMIAVFWLEGSYSAVVGRRHMQLGPWCPHCKGGGGGGGTPVEVPTPTPQGVKTS